MEYNFSLDAIAEVALDFSAQTAGTTVFALHGEMGAGKTTFVRTVCENAGVTDAVSSPTFSIINQYHCPDGRLIYHIDLYRLKDEQEAIQDGVEDCLYSGHTCFVEWPERAAGIFPEHTRHLTLTATGTNVRKLEINL